MTRRVYVAKTSSPVRSGASLMGTASELERTNEVQAVRIALCGQAFGMN